MNAKGAFAILPLACSLRLTSAPTHLTASGESDAEIDDIREAV